MNDFTHAAIEYGKYIQECEILLARTKRILESRPMSDAEAVLCDAICDVLKRKREVRSPRMNPPEDVL